MAAMAKKDDDSSDDETVDACSSGRVAAVTIQSAEDGTQACRIALSALKTVQKNRAPVERVAGAVLGGAGRVALVQDQIAVALSNVQQGKVTVYQVSTATLC